MFHNHHDLQAIHDVNLSKYKKAETRHVLRHKGCTVTMRVTAMDVVPVGAAFTSITQTDPTDGGGYTDDSTHSLFGIGPMMQDVNQNGLSDCWVLAILAALASFTKGQALLRALLQYVTDTNGNIVPNAAYMFFVRAGTITRVRMDFSIAAVQNQLGVSGSIWAAMIEKAYALFRTGANTYHSLDFGFVGDFMSDIGQINIVPVTSVSQARALIKGEGFGGLSTKMTSPPAPPMITQHAYGFLADVLQPADPTLLALRNPWGSNTGSYALQPAVTDSIDAINGFTMVGTPFVTIPAGLPTPPALPTTPVTPPVTPPVALPLAPANFHANSVTATDLMLFWDVVPVCDGYRIYQSPDGVTETVIGTKAGTDRNSFFVVTGLTAGTTYYFSISAYTAAGESLSKVIVVTTLGTPVTPPVTLPVTPPVTPGTTVVDLTRATSLVFNAATGAFIKAVP